VLIAFQIYELVTNYNLIGRELQQNLRRYFYLTVEAIEFGCVGR
jgi:hypothetical protein